MNTADLNHKTSEPTLNRAHWIDVALILLIDDGIDTVRITRLANMLGVTRGSFYWHFKDHGDLCEALVAHWKHNNTAAVLEAASDTASLDHGILALFDAWLDATRFDPRLDSAMRDWARRSDDVRNAVEQADAERITAIADMFATHGYEATEALIRARIIYFGQVGYYALDIDETLSQRMGYLEAYYRGFTGRELNADLATEYRARHLDTPEWSSQEGTA